MSELSPTATYCSSKHSHEPEIPPSLDAEGRCLVCCQLVRISDLERDLGLERESHETTKRMLDDATSALSATTFASRNAIIEQCADLAECASPNDGMDHSECPFCCNAADIRALKNAAPQADGATMNASGAASGDVSPAVAAPEDLGPSGLNERLPRMCDE